MPRRLSRRGRIKRKNKACLRVCDAFDRARFSDKRRDAARPCCDLFCDEKALSDRAHSNGLALVEEALVDEFFEVMASRLKLDNGRSDINIASRLSFIGRDVEQFATR